MIRTNILSELGIHCPHIVLGQVQCEVSNTMHNAELWEEINTVQSDIRKTYTLENTRYQVNISATRKVYKACGGDPNRYRPSADALYRRIVKGNDLYQINTLVDLVNLFSLKSGFSIGGFDADKIVGNLTWGVGKKGEPYEGIGRGPLNIEGLPVIRDEKGPIGTPTSDEIRTAISLETTHFLMNINGYARKEDVEELLNFAIKYLNKYTQAKKITMQLVYYNA